MSPERATNTIVDHEPGAKQEGYYALQSLQTIEDIYEPKVVEILAELEKLSPIDAQQSKLLKLLWFLPPERNALRITR